MKEVIRMQFGSHLYGTNTPESDLDYKGIFLPDRRNILLGRIPNTMSEHTGDSNSKNTSGDIDSDMYSLHYFIKLACGGETEVMDMLHAPENKWIHTDNTVDMLGMVSTTRPEWKFQVWRRIVDQRHRFYTKDMHAYAGYIGRQAHKYGIKGSRVNAANIALEFLSGFGSKSYMECRMSDLWDDLPLNELLTKYEDNAGNKFYVVCDRKIQSTVWRSTAYDIVSNILHSYGDRARKAASNEGIDWKALSHAFRASYQLIDIYTNGTITYPLPMAEELINIKLGKYDFKSWIEPRLEELIDRVEALAQASSYPDRVDRVYWDNFIVDTIDEYVL